MQRLHPTVDDDVDVETSYDDVRPPREGRPYVLVNMVASADGAIAVDGRTKEMSSPADKAVFHLLRSLPDVILAGAQTVRAESYGPPKISEERQARRVERGQAAVPTIAVVTRSLQLDLSSRLFTESRPIVICPVDADLPDGLAERADVVQAGEGDVDLTDAMRQLRERGVGVVLCEGGPTLNGDLARQGLIDELCLTIAPLLVGGDLGTGILGRARLPITLPLELAQVLEEGGDLLLRYRVGANDEVAAATAAEAAEIVVDESGTEAFDSAMGQLDPPMQIVTAAVGDERGGCLVGFAAQCSIQPPRFMVWLSKKNHTLTIARRASVLAVHFPGPDQRDLAERFGTRSGDDVDKLAGERWHEGPHGVPVLDDVPRWFAGRVTERLDSGDHVAFMLEPVAGSVAPDDLPQLGFQSVKDLDPGHEA